jgi:hypothetical protein
MHTSLYNAGSWNRPFFPRPRDFQAAFRRRPACSEKLFRALAQELFTSARGGAHKKPTLGLNREYGPPFWRGVRPGFLKTIEATGLPTHLAITLAPLNVLSMIGLQMVARKEKSWLAVSTLLALKSVGEHHCFGEGRFAEE